MKTRVLCVVVLMFALPMLAQKKEEKPKVHADFWYSSYPTSREFQNLMANEQNRLLIVSRAEGWDNERVAKQYKLTVRDLNVLSDKLEDDLLIRRSDDDYIIAPGLPVIRERDWLKVKEPLKKHTEEFSAVLQRNWAEIEAMVTSLEGSKGVPKERLMYETVVSGVLLGGLVDAFYEDKTIMPPGPLRGKNKNTRYYAWFTENQEAAGKLKREVRESDTYRIISIGTELPPLNERPTADELRAQKATVLEEADAIKYRRFLAVFSRDKLLPWFKSHRQEFLNQGALVGRNYVQAREVFAWYFHAMVEGVVDNLIASKKIAPPEKYYTYAAKIPQ